MAVIALASACGSPGVSTTAVGLALVWPRPVLLVEADPTGGSALLAGYFRGIREYRSGLMELALTSDHLSNAVAAAAEPVADTAVSFIAGTRSHAQARALADLWGPLAEVLADLEETGQDVIIDAGRLGLAGTPAPLLSAADLTLLVTRTTLPAIAAVRSWTDALARGALDWPHAGLVVVGDGQPYRASELTRALGLPAVAVLPDTPQAASVFSQGATPPRGFESSAYVRALHALVAACRSRISAARDELSDGILR